MIRFLIDIYIFLILLDAILIYFPNLNRYPARQYLRVATEFTQAPVRKYLPQELPLDFSPLVVIMILKLFVALF